jgi:hypothetical protein
LRPCVGELREIENVVSPWQVRQQSTKYLFTWSSEQCGPDVVAPNDDTLGVLEGDAQIHPAEELLGFQRCEEIVDPT